MTLARAGRGHHQVRSGCVAYDGGESRRQVEPYQMVATGRRWYLLAFGLERDDWRTFRLVRMSEVRATTWAFAPREAPDAREYVARAVCQAAYRYVATVRYAAPAATVGMFIPPTVGTIEPLGDDSCLVTAGADHLGYLAMHLANLGVKFEVLEPAEVREVVSNLAGRLQRAVRR